jgi:hypothetical protein
MLRASGHKKDALWYYDSLRPREEEPASMRAPLRAVIVSLALAGASIGLAGCVVAPGGGEVAFGYRDGYWDRGHHWHAWASEQDAARFRASDSSHFYNRGHDEDRNQGWNDNDRYWDHR